MAQVKSKKKSKAKAEPKLASRVAVSAGPETRLAGAALKLLAKTAWPELTLAAVARAACVPPRELQAIASSKPALLGLILHRIGAEVAVRYRPEPGSAHDRLFEVAMCWFDVLVPERKAVRALYDGLKRDPLTLVAARAGIVDAASWLLTLAEADTGPALPLRALALAAALGRAVPVWLDDDKDLTRTMACLDMDLTRADTILDRMRGAEANEDGAD